MQDEDFSLEDESSFTIKKILAFLEKEITEDQYFTEAWLIKGTVLYKTGKYRSSIEAFDNALETIPEIISKENLYLWKKSDNINYKYALKFKALALFKLGRYKEALDTLNEILLLYPENVEIQKYKNMLSTLEDESLIKELNTLPYNSPEVPGKGHRDRQVYEPKYVRALEEFDQCLEINPDNADIWSYKGSALYTLGRYEEALEAFDKSLEINPKNENVWSFKGSTLYMLDRPEKALKALDKALQKNPNRPEAWFNKGSILFELGRYKQSLSAVENTLRISAEDTNALNLKNSILHKLGEDKKPIT
ncbi:tetratricopeptide repeat protein [Methanosarcina sp.]|uniref:tetratricopeptide repeat protein n=1 Tax=Methanosarcina sp. TaxID=2213 RepID=UPI0029894780|nr:tetratricopeptide repeat protein [Methanosarcina sp.]MDW5548748.1 tetratricopeptide repeat protein [Methanosarcina sp.]MDW5553661.1 tetratricopeptide repeat protein [Methanosarcina sp.]MDW5558887.1 tetratricopeptide repeat protein [Methanosarcina sp.]